MPCFILWSPLFLRKHDYWSNNYCFLNAVGNICVEKSSCMKSLDTLLYPGHDQVSYVSLYASTHNPCLQPSVVYIFSPWCISYMYKWNLKVAQINTTWVAVYWCSLHIGRLVVNICVQCHKPTPSHQCNECNMSQIIALCIHCAYCHSHMWIYTSVVGVLWSFSKDILKEGWCKINCFSLFLHWTSSNLLRLAVFNLLG